MNNCCWQNSRFELGTLASPKLAVLVHRYLNPWLWHQKTPSGFLPKYFLSKCRLTVLLKWELVYPNDHGWCNWGDSYCSPSLPWYQLGPGVYSIGGDHLPVCLPSSLSRTQPTFLIQETWVTIPVTVVQKDSILLKICFYSVKLKLQKNVLSKSNFLINELSSENWFISKHFVFLAN